jgi:hypothetical protein
VEVTQLSGVPDVARHHTVQHCISAVCPIIPVRSVWAVGLCPEDGGSMDLRNVGIPPQPYTASQPRRPRLETSK